MYYYSTPKCTLDCHPKFLKYIIIFHRLISFLKKKDHFWWKKLKVGLFKLADDVIATSTNPALTFMDSWVVNNLKKLVNFEK